MINTPRGKSQCLNVNRENNEREWHEKSEKRRDNSKIMDRSFENSTKYKFPNSETLLNRRNRSKCVHASNETEVNK